MSISPPLRPARLVVAILLLTLAVGIPTAVAAPRPAFDTKPDTGTDTRPARPAATRLVQPGVAYEVLRRIRPASQTGPGGKRIRVPVKPKHGLSTVLLGRSTRGWLVVDTYVLDRVLRFRTGGQPVVATRQGSGRTDPVFMLSDDGTRIARYTDGADAAELRVTDLEGHQLLQRKVRRGGLVTFTGEQVVVGSPAVLIDVDGGTSRKLGRALDDADLDHGLLVTASGTRRRPVLGAARLSAPRNDRWRVAGLVGGIASDDARSVAAVPLGRPGGHLGVQVRSAGTGRLLASASLPGRQARTVRWAGNRHIVLLAVRGSRANPRQALIRCSVRGHCVRSTPWLNKRHFVSVAGDHFFDPETIRGDFYATWR